MLLLFILLFFKAVAEVEYILCPLTKQKVEEIEWNKDFWMEYIGLWVKDLQGQYDARYEHKKSYIPVDEDNSRYEHRIVPNSYWGLQHAFVSQNVDSLELTKESEALHAFILNQFKIVGEYQKHMKNEDSHIGKMKHDLEKEHKTGTDNLTYKLDEDWEWDHWLGKESGSHRWTMSIQDTDIIKVTDGKKTLLDFEKMFKKIIPTIEDISSRDYFFAMMKAFVDMNYFCPLQFEKYSTSRNQISILNIQKENEALRGMLKRITSEKGAEPEIYFSQKHNNAKFRVRQLKYEIFMSIMRREITAFQMDSVLLIRGGVRKVESDSIIDRRDLNKWVIRGNPLSYTTGLFDGYLTDLDACTGLYYMHDNIVIAMMSFEKFQDLFYVPPLFSTFAIRRKGELTHPRMKIPTYSYGSQYTISVNSAFDGSPFYDSSDLVMMVDAGVIDGSDLVMMRTYAIKKAEKLDDIYRDLKQSCEIISTEHNSELETNVDYYACFFCKKQMDETYFDSNTCCSTNICTVNHIV